MPGMVPHLVFCAGVVDMAAPGGGQPVALDKAMYCLRTMLTEAAPLAPTLVISPPPVADPTVRRRIAELSAAQAALCAELGLPFADIHAALAASHSYMGDLSDGLHPGSEGCTVMAETLLTQNTVRDFLHADMGEEGN